VANRWLLMLNDFKVDKFLIVFDQIVTSLLLG